MKKRLGMALVLGLLASSAWAQNPAVQLFKLITVKDEITIGLTAAEAEALTKGPVLDALAQKLADEGEITVWQYAVRKNDNGDLEQAPLRRVAIFKADSLRLEPLNPAPLKVVAPQE